MPGLDAFSFQATNMDLVLSVAIGYSSRDQVISSTDLFVVPTLKRRALDLFTIASLGDDSSVSAALVAVRVVPEPDTARLMMLAGVGLLLGAGLRLGRVRM
jgi:hypothetical protein